MTLIFAGYEYEKSPDYSWFSDDAPPYVPEMRVCGLFAVADSAITSHQGGRTILNGFRKVYELEAKLWKPYFMPDGSFRNYLEVYERRDFFVGFAGSTLTAQHILNSITEHLSQLRISYSRVGGYGPIKYEVIRHCQTNPLASPGILYWDDETFTDRDFEGLLKGSVIAEYVEYSINNALFSASSYKLSMAEFQDMRTDIICGIWCPYAKRHELYLFRMMNKKGEDGVLFAYTEKQFVKENEIAVLGMTNSFEVSAQQRFNEALSNFKSPAGDMCKFLEECIDQVQNSGSKEIDRPISFRRLNQSEITRVK
jgi:hypothetical protein